MARFGYFSYSDTNCKLLTFAIYGNRILQVNINPEIHEK